MKGMMDTAPIIAPIWDYGWLCRDQMDFPQESSDRALVDAYLNSARFHTSFLPTDKRETGLHGPFQASLIVSDDFVAFEQHALDGYLKDVLCSDEWEMPASDDQLAAVARLLSEPFSHGARCYHTERFEQIVPQQLSLRNLHPDCRNW